MNDCVQHSSETTGLIVASSFILLGTLVLTLLTLTPDSRTNTVAVIFPLGTSAAKTLQTTIELGGNPIASSRSGKVVVANFTQIPGLSKLWDSGALMAVDPLVAVGCTPIDRKTY